MRCDRDFTVHSLKRVRRAGFLCLGAFREVLVISMAAAIVLMVLWQVQAFIRSSALPEVAGNLTSQHPAVLGLDLDQDTQSLVVHSFRGQIEQIDLASGTFSKRQRLPNLISFAASARNSTSIMLSQWSTGASILHQVYVVRDQELLLSEKLQFPLASSADVLISADGQIALVVGHEGLVQGWDLSSAEPVYWQFQMSASVLSCRLSFDGAKLLVVSVDGCPLILDARTGEKRLALPRILEINRSLAWSQDGGRVAMGDQGGGIYVFDGKTGERIWDHKLDFLFARCVGLSDDGNLLAVGGFDKQIRIWNLSQPTLPPAVLTGETGVVHNFVFASADTRLFSGSTDGTIREWSLESNTLIRQLR